MVQNLLLVEVAIVLCQEKGECIHYKGIRVEDSSMTSPWTTTISESTNKNTILREVSHLKALSDDDDLTNMGSIFEASMSAQLQRRGAYS